MTIDDLSDWARGSGLEIVLIILGTTLVSRGVRAGLGHYAPTKLVDLHPGLSEHERYRRSLLQALKGSVVGALWFIAILLVLVRFNVPSTTLIAPVTVIGAALGLGSQRYVADFLGGMFLIAERQVAFGDVIQIAPPGQLGGAAGTVEEVTLRYTRLRSSNGDVITLPNSEIRQILKRSQGWGRLEITVPISVKADIGQVTDELERSLSELRDDDRWRGLLLEPPSIAGIEQVDVDRLNLKVSGRVQPDVRGEVARELHRRSALVASRAARHVAVGT